MYRGALIVRTPGTNRVKHMRLIDIHAGKLRSDFISSLFTASLLGAFTTSYRLYTQIYRTKKPKLYKNIELTVAKFQNKCKRNIRLEKALEIR
jgi:hypothetical protein